jgi:hypothetical protein
MTARLTAFVPLFTLLGITLQAQHNTYVPVNTNETVQQVNNAPNNTDNNNSNTDNFHPFRGNVFQTRINNAPVNQQDNVPQGPENSNTGNGTNGMVNYNQGSSTNSTVNDSDSQGKKPYCKECEELKKLKRQQTQLYFSGHVTGTANKHRWSKFRSRANKKMQKWFAKEKKKRPNYSCFNW